MQEIKLQKIMKIEEDSMIKLKSIIEELLSHYDVIKFNVIPYLLNIEIHNEEYHAKLHKPVSRCDKQFTVVSNKVLSKVEEDKHDLVCDKQLAVLAETNEMESFEIRLMLQEQRNVIEQLQLNYRAFNAIAKEISDNIATLQSKLRNLNIQLHKREVLVNNSSTGDEHNQLQVVVNIHPRVTKKVTGHAKKMISKANQANQKTTSLLDKQKQKKQKLREYKTKVADLETVISQHKRVVTELNKEAILLEQSKMQLEKKLEKATRNNMVMKSKLEIVEENYKMQSEHLEKRCEELKRHNNSLMENVRLFNKVLIKLPSVVKQIVSEDDELTTALQM